MKADVLKKIFITIPCYREPTILDTLKSLDNCIQINQEITVLINVNDNLQDSSDTIAFNDDTYSSLVKFQNSFNFRLEVIRSKLLDRKHSGVGVARKEIMDIASDRLITQNMADGLIVCLDADCKVSTDYLLALVDYLDQNPKSPACSIYFEHPLDHLHDVEKTHIANYELHLRYLVEAQRWCGLPYAFHTVGSSMAVRAGDYNKMGGMNKRKAGEDFHFLHKFTIDPNFLEINNCTVFPSSRMSDRVPFGTGRAMLLQNESSTARFDTSSFASFELIRSLILSLPEVYQRLSRRDTIKNLIEPDLHPFFEKELFYEDLEVCFLNTSKFESFKKRFFTVFSPIFLVRLLHHLRDHGYPDQPILSEAQKLVLRSNLTFGQENKLIPLLTHYRNLQRGKKCSQ